MLSREQREIIEREAADQIRQQGTARHGPVASAVDDIRHKVIEEGWYGRQVTGEGWYHGQGPQGAGIHGNQASAADIYGAASSQGPTAGPTMHDDASTHYGVQPVASPAEWPQASKDAAMGLGPDHAAKKDAAASLYGPAAEKKEAGMGM